MTVEEISIQLDNATGMYQPSDLLSGQYQLSWEEVEDLKAVELSVLWFTEGKGDEDIGVHFFDRVDTEEMDPRELVRARGFETQLPKSPLSYDGVIVKIRWCVRIRLIYPRGKERTREIPVQLGSVPSAQVVKK